MTERKRARPQAARVFILNLVSGGHCHPQEVSLTTFSRYVRKSGLKHHTSIDYDYDLIKQYIYYTCSA